MANVSLYFEKGKKQSLTYWVEFIIDGQKRYQVAPGTALSIELEPGAHTVRALISTNGNESAVAYTDIYILSGVGYEITYEMVKEKSLNSMLFVQEVPISSLPDDVGTITTITQESKKIGLEFGAIGIMIALLGVAFAWVFTIIKTPPNTSNVGQTENTAQVQKQTTILHKTEITGKTLPTTTEATKPPTTKATTPPTTKAPKITKKDNEVIITAINTPASNSQNIKVTATQIKLAEPTRLNTNKEPVIGITFEIVNNSDKDYRMITSGYADDLLVEKDFGYKDWLIFMGLAPGKRIIGSTYFRIPKDAKKIEVRFENYSYESFIFLLDIPES